MPEPVYETVSALMLEIVEPAESGIRKRWKDAAKRKLEDALDGFLRSAMALAEHMHTEMEEKERKRREEEAAQNLAHRRIKPPSHASPAASRHEPPRPNVAAYFHEIDLWRQRALFGCR